MPKINESDYIPTKKDFSPISSSIKDIDNSIYKNMYKDKALLAQETLKSMPISEYSIYSYGMLNSPIFTHTISSISSFFGSNERTTRRYLDRLIKKGLVLCTKKRNPTGKKFIPPYYIFFESEKLMKFYIEIWKKIYFAESVKKASGQTCQNGSILFCQKCQNTNPLLCQKCQNRLRVGIPTVYEDETRRNSVNSYFDKYDRLNKELKGNKDNNRSQTQNEVKKQALQEPIDPVVVSFSEEPKRQKNDVSDGSQVERSAIKASNTMPEHQKSSLLKQKPPYLNGTAELYELVRHSDKNATLKPLISRILEKRGMEHTRNAILTANSKANGNYAGYLNSLSNATIDPAAIETPEPFRRSVDILPQVMLDIEQSGEQPYRELHDFSAARRAINSNGKKKSTEKKEPPEKPPPEKPQPKKTYEPDGLTLFAIKKIMDDKNHIGYKFYLENKLDKYIEALKLDFKDDYDEWKRSKKDEDEK